MDGRSQFTGRKTVSGERVKMNRKAKLAERLREFRQYLYGEDGLENLADALGVPAKPGETTSVA